MAVLRDILAHFTVFVDDRPLTQLDKRINKVKDNIKDFAVTTGAVLATAGYGAYKLVEAASDANEALNVLQVTFKDNTDAVLDWSTTVAEQMGRSQYTFQESVGKFGAFLSPVFKESEHDITQMSERLAELAVDLASFYNTSDSEAVTRLFSGMSGETEAVRKYGVDISDSALDDFNKKMGDHRTMRSLSLQEKSLLRYRKILIDTEAAQGDAERTAGSWANQVKRLQERAKTLAVTIGKKILPVALDFLDAINGGITKVEEVVKFIEEKSSVLRAALLTVSSLVAAMAIQSVIANWAELSAAAVLFGDVLKTKVVPQLMTGAAMAGKLAIAFLVLEDVIGFLRGQDSVLGSLLSELTGMSEPIRAFREGWAEIAGYVVETFSAIKGIVSTMFAIPKHINNIKAMMGIGDAKHEDYGTFDDVRSPAKVMSEMRAKKAEVATFALQQGGEEGRKSFLENRRMDQSEVDAQLEFMDKRKSALGALEQGKPSKIGQVQVTNEDVAAGFLSPEYLQALNEAASGKGAEQSLRGTLRGETRNNIKIEVKQSNATPQDIKKAVEEALDESERKAAAALDEEG
jgi:hypothetical protein